MMRISSIPSTHLSLSTHLMMQLNEKIAYSASGGPNRGGGGGSVVIIGVNHSPASH